MSDEFQITDQQIIARLSPEERLRRVGTPTGLTARQANAITQSRLQLALSDLAEMNVDNVNKWLNEVGQRAPAEAIRLYLELLEFRMPRMKAAQVAVHVGATAGKEGTKELKDMSIEELQSVVAEQ